MFEFGVGEPMPSYNLHHSRIEENWDNAIEDELWKNI